MAVQDNQKLQERNIPGMNRRERFGEVEHAENAGEALKRLAAYFVHEKGMVAAMLAAVVFGTVCGVCAPGLQSDAVDIIAGERAGALLPAVLLMLAVYLLYSGSQGYSLTSSSFS